MTDRPLKFALIGAGRIAQAWVQAFDISQEAIVVAVVDTCESSASELAGRLNCPTFRHHTDLDGELPIDAALICTPPASHFEISRFFLTQGIPVYCEKPLCLDVEESRELFATAREAGVMLAMAAKFRYVDDVIRAAELIDSGLLGDVVLFKNEFLGRVDMSTRWNSEPSISGGGVLIDNGTHSVDLVSYFIGPIAAVRTSGAKYHQLQVEETVQLELRNAQGVSAIVDLSWRHNGHNDAYISVEGTKGSLHVGWKRSEYLISGASEPVPFGVGYSKLEAFRKQIDNFSRAVRGEEDLLLNGDAAIDSVEVISAAYASLASGDWFVLDRAKEPIESIIG